MRWRCCPAGSPGQRSPGIRRFRSQSRGLHVEPNFPPGPGTIARRARQHRVEVPTVRLPRRAILQLPLAAPNWSPGPCLICAWLSGAPHALPPDPRGPSNSSSIVTSLGITSVNCRAKRQRQQHRGWRPDVVAWVCSLRCLGGPFNTSRICALKRSLILHRSLFRCSLILITQVGCCASCRSYRFATSLSTCLLLFCPPVLRECVQITSNSPRARNPGTDGISLTY